MNKNLVSLLVVLFVLLASMTPFLANAITLPNPLCLNPNPNGPCISSPTCVCSIADLVQKIIDYVLTVIGVLATLMFVWAGILFVTSAGSPEKINQAKKAAIYAAIGAGIALAGKGLILVIKEVIGTPPS